MSVLPEDLGPALRAAKIVEHEDPAVKTRHPLARDGREAPAPGYCDDAADTATLLEARFALMGAEPARFAVATDGVAWPDLGEGVPCFRLRDAEHRMDGVCLTGRIELDLNAEQTSYELWAGDAPGLPVLPAGMAFVTTEDGAYLVDETGAYVIEDI